MNKKILVGVAILIIGPILAYTASPLFIETTIDEAIPDNVITSETVKPFEPVVSDAIPNSLFDKIDKELALPPAQREKLNSHLSEMNDMIENSGENKQKLIKQIEEKYGDMAPEMMIDESMEMKESIESAQPTFVTYSGQFEGVGDGVHNSQGDARTLKLDNGDKIIRLENFRSTNGPALHVYLATDKSASDYIDLGSLKATMGNQNYVFSSDIDLDKYNHVLIWCQPFSVLFGHAELAPDN